MGFQDIAMPYRWPFPHDPHPSFLLMSFRAGAIWNATKPSPGNDQDGELDNPPNGIQPVAMYTKIIAGGWAWVGCDWSRDCRDVEGNEYVLYCQLG
jgi:hypothetical protein